MSLIYRSLIYSYKRGKNEIEFKFNFILQNVKTAFINSVFCFSGNCIERKSWINGEPFLLSLTYYFFSNKTAIAYTFWYFIYLASFYDFIDLFFILFPLQQCSPIFNRIQIKQIHLKKVVTSISDVTTFYGY